MVLFYFFFYRFHVPYILLDIILYIHISRIGSKKKKIAFTNNKYRKISYYSRSRCSANYDVTLLWASSITSEFISFLAFYVNCRVPIYSHGAKKNVPNGRNVSGKKSKTCTHCAKRLFKMKLIRCPERAYIFSKLFTIPRLPTHEWYYRDFIRSCGTRRLPLSFFFF